LHNYKESVVDLFHEKLNGILDGLREGVIKPNYNDHTHLVKVLCCGLDKEMAYVAKSGGESEDGEYFNGEKEPLWEYMAKYLEKS
jgi:hypothetical protein